MLATDDGRSTNSRILGSVKTRFVDQFVIITLIKLGVYVPSTTLTLIGVFSAVKHNKAKCR